MIERRAVAWAIRSAGLVLTPLLLTAPGCTSEVPSSEADEAKSETSQELLGDCPPGYLPTQCDPETICYRAGDCVLKTVCICVEAPPFPVPFPQMPENGGATLPQLQLVTITFTGDTQYDASLTSTDAEAFGEYIVHSPWLTAVTADYTTAPFVGNQVGTVRLPAYTGGVVDVPTLLEQGILDETIPLPADTQGLLYLVYVPPGEACATTQYPQESYHESISVNGVSIAYARVCGNGAFAPGNTAPSHEIVEAITDPFNGSGYWFSGNDANNPWNDQGEVADACQGFDATAGGYSLATAWSNKAATKAESPCIPAPAMYHNVSPSSPDVPWTQWDTAPLVVTENVPVTITLTGWSYPTDPGQWDVKAVVNTAASDFTPTVTLDGSTGPVSIGTKQSVTLTITAPPGTSGLGAFVDVESSMPTGYGVWPFLIEVQ